MNHLYFLLAVACCSEIRGLTKDDSTNLDSILSHLSLLESRQQSTMTALQKTMDDLQSTKTEVQASKTELQATKVRLNTTASELEATKAQLSTITSDFQATKAQLSTTTSDLQATKTQLSTTTSDLQSEKRHYAAEITSLRNELALKTKDESFHVHLSTRVRTTKSQPVKFNIVHHNSGNGYSTTTGKFTAPISGTYIFSAGVERETTSDYTYIKIVQSGSDVSSGYGHKSSDTDITVSVTAITHVRQGEQVWVATTNSVILYGGDWGYPTHFVGALLHVD